MLAADQGVEEEPVDRGHDCWRRGGADLAGRNGDEPVSGPHEWRAQRGVASGHQEQLVAGQRQGSPRSQPVLQGRGGVPLDLLALPIGQMVEQGADQRRPVAEVVANRTVRKPGGVLHGPQGEPGRARAAQELEGAVQQVRPRVVLHMEKDR